MTPAPPQPDQTWAAMFQQRLKRLHDFLFGAGALQQAAGQGQMSPQPLATQPSVQPAYDDPLAIQKMAEAMRQRQKGKQ